MNYETVLIVHFSQPEREMLREFVTAGASGVNIREVATEPEAEQIIKQQHFDVILSSIFIDSFKHLAESGTHIIALIPDESETQLSRLARRGLTHYQVFPIREEVLQDQLNSLTRGGVSRKHQRFDVPGTKIQFHDESMQMEGRILNISQGGFLCEIVVDKADADFPREIPVTIQFPRKYGKRMIENIRCHYLATRRSVEEGSKFRQLVVMLIPRFEAHHFEALVMTLQRVIRKQHPLLQWHNSRLELNIGGRRSYYYRIQLLRIVLVVLLLIGLVGGLSYYFTVPRTLWIADKPVALVKPVADSHPQVMLKKQKIIFQEKIQFAKGDSTINQDSHVLLNEIAEVIKRNPQIRLISINGHSDSDGTKAFNHKLSGRRAGAVLQYLVARGVTPSKLQLKGFGDSQPLASNQNDDGKRINRRVEFVILQQQ